MKAKSHFKVHTSEERRRLFEIGAMIGITVLLVSLSRLEARLFDLSTSLAANTEFLTTVVYFGLINLNVVLILILAFLIFRNVAKLVLERRRGVLGSKLRTKLIVTLVFFALAPTILMFYVSSSFITSSFDTWFSQRVRNTMQQTREAGTQVYKQDQRRLESLARIALQRVDVLPVPNTDPPAYTLSAHRLKGFENDYGLEGVRVYDATGKLIWTSYGKKRPEVSGVPEPALMEAIERFIAEPGLLSRGTVEADETKDTVKGFAPLYYHQTSKLVGVVLTEEHFKTQILRSIEAILAEFASLRDGAQFIRLCYLIILVLMVMLIGFATTWLGFYVARGIVNPIQSLSEAMREVALGNYSVQLPTRTDDETGALVKAFEKMIVDLKDHEDRNERFTRQLQLSNEEVNRRHRYMEVVLRNITAGVISVEPNNTISSFNNAAERLLELNAKDCLGKDVNHAFGPLLADLLWNTVVEKIAQQGTFTGQIDLEAAGRNVTLIAAGIRIFDEHGMDLGVVLVFDDATEQARAQRVAAWREVARRIAHEIKNPITPIKLSAERLLRRYGKQFEGENREVFETCIATILTQVDSLRDLVNEFSKFSRMPAIKTKPENLNQTILDVANLFKMSYSDIQFNTSELANALPLIHIDKEQMNRVVMNVVSNAVAALQNVSGEKVILFRTRVVEMLNAVRLEVADTGCGIPAKEKDRVFEPYYSTKKEGTGLGLAIVNQIVSDHGGYVRITDYEPRGTKLIIDLPMGDDRELAKPS